MRLAFTKMQGLGNDFVVIDAVNQTVNLSKQQIQALSDRHLGIGCDQLLLVQAPSVSNVDFDYRIFNANGSEVEQCGNGARCVARFIHDIGLSSKAQLSLATQKAVIQCEVLADGQVKVGMGEPVFSPEAIPLVADQQHKTYPFDYENSRLEVSVLSMGNPHAVIEVPDVKKANVEAIGSFLEKHPRFPEGVNVGFMQVKSREAISLRVFERHVGETQACGSGACAAVVAGVNLGLLDAEVMVDLPGGQLLINFTPGEQVVMQGPAEFVFTGEITL